MAPTRVLDARGRSPLERGRARAVAVAGVGGVPTGGVGAVVLAVSASDAARPTVVTVAPTGGAVAARIATTPLIGTTSDVLVPLGPDGTVTFDTTVARTGMVAEVVGWYPTGDVRPVPATRVLDTAATRTTLAPARPIDVTVAGIAGVPATGVAAVVLAVRGAQATAVAGVSVAPAGAPAPGTRQLSVVPLLESSSQAVVPMGADGKVTFRLTAGRAVVSADVVGWIPSTSSFTPVSPVRVLDTARARTPLTAGRPVDVGVVAGLTPPADGVVAVVLQLNASDATVPAAVSVQQTGDATTARTALTTTLLLPTANQVVVPVDASGRVTLATTFGRVHVSVDVVGFFATSELPPPTGGSWRFEPAVVNLAAVGEKVTVRLVHVDDDGAITAHRPPASVTTALVGDAAATVARTARGVYEVTATATVGQTLLTVTDGGASFALPLDITNARLQPGVVTLPTGSVVFPARAVPFGVDPATVPGSGVTATGVGPFTWAELVARTVVATADPNDPASILDPDQTEPWVLRGDAPPVGTVVLTAGDRHHGRIVELPDQPTITRDGHTLVSVRAGSMLDVYTELRSGLTDAEYELVAPRVTASTSPPGAPTGGVPTFPGRSRLAAPRLGAVGAEACTLTGGLTPLNFSLAAPVSPQGSYIHARPPEIGFGSLSLRIEVQLETTTTFGITALLGLTGSGTVTCKLLEPKPIVVPAAGWLSGIVSMGVKPEAGFEAALTVAGGPRLGFNYTCVQHSISRTTFVITQGPGLPAPSITRDASNDLNVPPEDCPSWSDGTVTFDTGSNSATDIPVQVSGSLGLYASATFALIPFPMLNGIFSELPPTAAELLADGIDLGELKANVGFKVAWENTRSVLEASTGSSYASFELSFTGALKVTAFVWISEKLSGVKGQLTAELQLFNVPVSLLSLYRTVNGANPMRVTVDGTATMGDAQTVKAHTGSTVAVELTTVYTTVVGRPLGGDAPVRDAKAWLRQGGSWEALPEFVLGVGGDRITGSIPVTKALCDKLGPDGSTVTIVPDVPMVGVATPGYAARFTLVCDGELAWEPTSLSLTATKKTAPVPVNAKGKGLNGATFTATAALAPWLTITPATGTFPSSDATVPLQVVADCDVLAPATNGQGIILLATDTPGVESQSMSVSLSCTDDYFQFQPNTLTGSGAANLVNRFADPATWTITSVPTWITVSPRSGTLAAGPSTHPVSVTVTRRVNSFCQVALPARTGTVRATRADGTFADLVVTDPAVPPRTCATGPSSTGSGTGDPHMRSFDGAYFDAQVLGEYAYFRPTDAAATEPALYVRHGLAGTVRGVGTPTVVTAAAYLAKGHRVEVYMQPEFRVLVDGEPTTDRSGAFRELSPGLGVAVWAGRVDIADDGVAVRVYVSWGILNVSATVVQGTPVAGLLGTPDGNAANDLVSAGGTAITLAEAQAHGAALYGFTDSWRLTDPADSPFTTSDPGFADPNPIHDLAGLEPYRQQVLAQLGPITSACDVANGWSNYELNALALELANGQPLRSLPDYTCRYDVRGTARTAPSGDGLTGLTVTVDGPGLQPCVTITGPSGAYSCPLAPSLDELAIAPAAFPLTVSVTAAWSTGGPPVASGSVAFATAAKVGDPLVATADLVVDPASLPVLAVTGTLVGNDGAWAEPVTVAVTAFDAGGRSVLGRRVPVLPDPVSGAYDFDLALSGTVTRVELVAQVGDAVDWVRREVTGLRPGVNPVVFDATWRPNVLSVSGVFTERGVGLTRLVTITAEATGPGYRDTFRATVVPGPDGSYATELVLPVRATAATLTADIGVLIDHPSLALTDLTGGPLWVDFSHDHRPTLLTMSGTLVWLGQVTGADFTFRPFDADGRPLGTYSSSVEGAPDTGEYVTTVVLPVGASRTDVFVTERRPGEGTSTVSFGIDLVPGEDNTGAYSIDPLVLRVTGIITQLGAALPAATVVDLRVSYFDAQGNNISGLEGTLTPDGFGNYLIASTTGAQAASAEIVLNGGEARATVTDLQPGLNLRTVDFDLAPLGPETVVTGTVRDGDGGPVGGDTVRVEVVAYRIGASWDATPVWTQAANFFVDDIPVAEDGTYRTSVYVPAGTTFASVVAMHSSGDAERSGVTTVSSTDTTRLTLDLDLGRRNFLLWGSARACGAVPYVPRVQLWAFDGAPATDYDQVTGTWPGGELVYDGLAVPDADTAAFGVYTPVPEGFTYVGVRWSAEGSPSLVPGATGSTRLVPIPADGPADYGLDLDLSCPTEAPTLTVTGSVRRGGVAVTDGPVRLEVIPVRIVGPWNATPSFEELPPVVAGVAVAADGTYTATVTLPIGATLATIHAVYGVEGTWRTPVVTLVAGPNTVVHDIDLGLRGVSFVGDAVACGERPYLPRLELFGFTSAPPGGYDGASGSWPGGVELFDAFVVPDPVTGRYVISAPVPIGVTHLGIRYGTEGTPIPLPVQASTSSVLTISPTASVLLGWDLRINCPA